MVKGRKGLYLEAWKFGVYISLPVIASVYYSNPDNQRYWADYWQFIKYPENPNTNVKQQIKELAEQKEKQKEQRRLYQEQLRQLQMASERSETGLNDDSSTDSKPWWRRAGGWITGKS